MTTAVQAPHTRRRRKEFGGGGPLVYGLALVVVALTVGPVLYGALGGFRSNEQIARAPAGLPDPWRLDNYANVVSNPEFWRYAMNSTVIALITTVIAVLAGVMAVLYQVLVLRRDTRPAR